MRFPGLWSVASPCSLCLPVGLCGLRQAAPSLVRPIACPGKGEPEVAPAGKATYTFALGPGDLATDQPRVHRVFKLREAIISLADENADPFTLIVTDVKMPRMDGLHLCKRIKEHPQLGEIPFVVFSSLVNDTNLKKCEVVGADAAITKPQMRRQIELLDGLLTRTGSADDRTDADMLLAVK